MDSYLYGLRDVELSAFTKHGPFSVNEEYITRYIHTMRQPTLEETNHRGTSWTTIEPFV